MPLGAVMTKKTQDLKTLLSFDNDFFVSSHISFDFSLTDLIMQIT